MIGASTRRRVAGPRSVRAPARRLKPEVRPDDSWRDRSNRLSAPACCERIVAPDGSATAMGG